MSVIRAAQLPAFVWIVTLVIKGPITRGDAAGLAFGVVCYGLLAVWTDGMFHFRQRYALEIGETVVNGLRADIFAKLQRQPMSFFHRVKLGRIIGRVTSDVEALRVGIQDVLFVSVIQFGQMFFTAAIMVWSDRVLFLVVLGLAPVLWVINRHFRVKLSLYSRAASDSFSRVTATLAESVNGIRVAQGFVRQQDFLFSGTVFENIRFARPGATGDEVRAAAAKLDCLDLLEGLPQGLQTEVGERGAALSVGQRQLICFTRALLADPRLMILDEATSSIDTLTEARLQQALVTLLRGRTSFVVAHRLSTIRHADLVRVLDQGRVIERGTHAGLLAQGGPYAALYRQFVQVDERA